MQDPRQGECFVGSVLPSSIAWSLTKEMAQYRAPLSDWGRNCEGRFFAGLIKMPVDGALEDVWDIAGVY